MCFEIVHLTGAVSAVGISNDLSLLKTCGSLQLFANYWLESGHGVQYRHFTSFERSTLRSARMLCKKYFKIKKHGPRVEKKWVTT